MFAKRAISLHKPPVFGQHVLPTTLSSSPTHAKDNNNRDHTSMDRYIPPLLGVWSLPSQRRRPSNLTTQHRLAQSPNIPFGRAASKGGNAKRLLKIPLRSFLW